MGLRISQLLDPSRVVLDIQSTKRTTAINEVARKLDGLPEMTNFAAFYAELLARERLDTTCIGFEVALPHARTDHATQMLMSAGRSREGVLFENCNKTVRLIFVLATPKDRAGDYLQAVGALCRVLKDDAVRARLMKADSSQDFVDALIEAEAEKRPAGAV